MVNLAFSSMALIEEKKGNLSVQELPMNMWIWLPTRFGLIRILKEAAIFHQFWLQEGIHPQAAYR
jgi:hypothetical protein